MTSIEVEKFVVMNEVLLNLEEENVKVPTSYGDILVQIYGERTKHPFVTFHDIGLNAEDNFRVFFQLFTPTEFAQEFCFYNINAPFQEKSAEHISSSTHYPTMENLSAIVDEIVRHFDFKSFVGMGIGAGSYVLLEYAVKHQSKLNGLILLNSIANAPSWYEWGREKLNVRDLRQHGITDSVVDFLMWHNFGTHIEKCNPDLIQGYREYFEQLNNPNNLAAFLESYLHRKAIEFPHGPCGHVSKCGHESSHLFIVPILQIVGERIYSLTDVEAIRAKLITSKNELVKLADCSGRVLDEAPDKVLEAMMLFLQGLGFFPSINVHEVLSRENEDVNEKITRTEISVKETMNE